MRAFDNFGGGASEGRAAVRGHQSGAKGMLAVKPVFSWEIEMAFGVMFRFPAPPPVLSKCKFEKASEAF